METVQGELRSLFVLVADIKTACRIASRFDILKGTLVERPQTDVGQFLAMLRFENRSKVEELISI